MFECKKLVTLLATAGALSSAAQAQDRRQAHPFPGPWIGVELGYEDFGSGTNGATVAALAGWDFAVGNKGVIGGRRRFALVGVDGSESSETPGGLIQTADVSIRDNCGAAAHVVHVVGGRVLIFGEAGYEGLRLDAVRTVRAAACVPPTS